MIRVLHRRSKCIGCASCEQAMPQRWRMSLKDGKSTLIGGTIHQGEYRLSAGNDESAGFLESAQNCPVKIIKVFTR
jgi:ferredoxin